MASWTQAICDPCWDLNFPGRTPVRFLEPESETCCACGALTKSGIYIRRDPRSCLHPTQKRAREAFIPPMAPPKEPEIDAGALKRLTDLGFSDDEVRPLLVRAAREGDPDPYRYVLRIVMR